MGRLTTPLCELLDIRYPILSVGFAEGAGPELVAAVSEAGGFGVLGGVPVAEMRRRAARVRALTSRPFGVNQIIASLEPGDPEDEDAGRAVRERVLAAVDERVAAIVLFWGDPAEFVAPAHAAQVKVIVQTGSVAEAVHAAEAGVDAVIAQGVEAGGHVRATESLWVTLPAVVEAVAPLPVIASGGIGDGSGIARALRMGAQGVSLGTRFVASTEAWTHPLYKERIVRGHSADTVLDTVFDVWWPHAPHRVLRNRVVADWEKAGRPGAGRRPGEGESIGVRHRPWGGTEEWPRYAVGMIPPDFEGDPEEAPMWAGTSVDAIHDVAPAAEIVARLVRETEAALA